MKRKITAVLCSMAMLASMGSMAYAQGEVPADTAAGIILTIDEKTASVFGEKVENDAAPFIQNSRTMVPVRFISEKMGLAVTWDSDKSAVVIGEGSGVITLTIGSDTADVNGIEVGMDAPAVIVSDRTFVPIRFVSENLGFEVRWDAEKRQVIISKNEAVSLEGISDDELKHRLADANKIDHILDKYGWVIWNRQYIDGKERTVVSSDYYRVIIDQENKDGSTVSVENSVDINGNVYGYEYGDRYCIIFDDVSYEDYRSYNEYRRRNLKVYQADSVLTERSVSDGVLTVTEGLSGPFTDSLKEVLAGYTGLDVEKITKIESTATYDAETLRKISEVYKAVQGKEIIEYASEYIEYGTGQPPEEDRSLDNEFFTGDLHTVTIVTGSGTDHEKTYSKTAVSDAVLYVWIEDSYGEYYDLYTDKECTQAYEADQVYFDEDKTLYMK